jgi:urease subunit alpha
VGAFLRLLVPANPVPEPRAQLPAPGLRREPNIICSSTIEPALTHGIAGEVGTLAPGRLADIVLWRPAFFGVRPELILKSGHFAWGAIDAGNATVEAAGPRRYGSHWGGLGNAPPSLSVTFVSQAALDDGVAQKLGRCLGGICSPDLPARLRWLRD